MIKREEKEPILKIGLTGFLIGIGAIAPGISGGAIAVIFGLYERITDTVAHFYRDFREKLRFLLPLGIGAALGVLLFGRVIEYLFANYNVQLRCLFVGLMLGTLPSVFRTANRDGFRLWYLLPMALCGVGIAWLATREGLGYTGGAEELPFWLAAVCGAVVGFGTIVPGVSASFVLMSWGLYEPMLRALNTLDVWKLLPMGAGFVLLILLFAKLVSYLYKRAYGLMSYAVAGLLLGSIVPVVPPLSMDWATVLSLLLAVIGAALSALLLRVRE